MNGLLYRSALRAAQALGRASVAAVCISLVACGGGGSGGGDGGGRRPPMMGGNTSSNPTVTSNPTTQLAPLPPTDVGAPPKTVLTLTPKQVKTFGFTWLPSGGATEFRLMEAVGTQPFQTIATVPGDVLSFDLQVFLPSRMMNVRYALVACNAAGLCASSDDVRVTPQMLTAAIGYVKPSNTVPDPAGGISPEEPSSDILDFSADGKTMVFSVYQEDGMGKGVNNADEFNIVDRGNNSGAVYVLVNNAGVWSQQAYIKASDSRPGLNFGMSVSLSADGNTLAVGATETSIFGGIKTNDPRGEVYIFTRSGTTWTEQGTPLRADNGEANDLFGVSLALSDDGNTLAVGAANEDSKDMNSRNDNSVSNSGAVYVFTRNDTGWSTPTFLKAATPAENELFGLSLALAGDGQTLAVGAPNQGGKGAIHIFLRNGADWIRQPVITASDSQTNDSFGFSLSFSKDGRTLAAGAGQAPLPPAASTGPGKVYIFVRDDSNQWPLQATLQAKITKNGDADSGDAFEQVSLTDDGNTLVVGAAGEASAARGLGGDPTDNSMQSGAAYLFTRSGSSWTQQAYIKASNTEAGDGFGFAVAIAGDGSVFGVVATGEASAARGVGGDQNDNSAKGGGGAVYLY